MPQQQQRCAYCDKPATLLCDFHLGWPIGGEERRRDGSTYVVRALALPYTCDLPLCRDHAETRGWVHIKARAPLGGFDSYDYCSEHRGQDDHGAPLIEEHEADRLRRAVHALAQRRVIRERGALKSPPKPPEQRSLF
jgi:hypothetical protein